MNCPLCIDQILEPRRKDGIEIDRDDDDDDRYDRDRSKSKKKKSLAYRIGDVLEEVLDL